MEIYICTQKLHFVIDVDENQKARLVHFSSIPWNRDAQFMDHKYHTLLELHCLGEDINDHHGSRHTYTSPGVELRYVSHRIEREGHAQQLIVKLTDGCLEVEQYYRFFDNSSVVRAWNKVKNISQHPISLLYLTSFAFYGLTGKANSSWDKEVSFYIPHNTWHGELQWRKNTMRELGISKLNRSSLKRLSISSTGSWSSGEYLPMGIMENACTKESLFWQIEHNGSWYWESSDVPGGGLYLQIGGPNFDQHHFKKQLHTGEEFVSVVVAVGAYPGGFESSIQELTIYRRLIRRPNRDNEWLPIVFNDYMNCLMGDPTEEKELPMIRAAAEAGCEYYVIDAGWFSQTEGGDDSWWPYLGIWEEAAHRFPHGLAYVMDYIREHGMIAGLWVELESMGCRCPLADQLPDEWFFQHGGKRVKKHERYQLDFRHPDVRRFATDILRNIIHRYQLGYIKIDYNINAGIGTDYQSDSLGEGLLEHNRALLAWLDSILEEFPDLVIENCASGGQRMDYAMLQRLSLQSTSDQTDYLQYAAIAAMAASAVTPEQAAVWSYPNQEGSEEETVFQMVNAMLGRVHQSGFLHTISSVNSRRIQEALTCYKSIRHHIRDGLPLFPLGIIHLDSPWAAFGIRKDSDIYLSVWRRDSEQDVIEIPMEYIGSSATVECLYPKGLPVVCRWEEEKCCLVVQLPEQRTARLIKITNKRTNGG